DHVYEDTIRSYEYARRRSEELIDARWEALMARIDTRGPGAPVVVFNTLGWTRSDIAEVDLGFAEPGVTGVDLTGPDGETGPPQVIEATRYGDGGWKTARIAFVARDIPAMGFGVYHAAPRRGPGRDDGGSGDRAAEGGVLENDCYRVSLDRSTGAMTGLRVKSGDWEALAGRGNVGARQPDRGDLWELYRGLDGGRRIAMTTRQPVPRRGEAVFSDEGKEEPGTLRTGPVLSEFRVARPFGSGRFATTVRVYQGLRRIEIATRLVNREKFV